MTWEQEGSQRAGKIVKRITKANCIWNPVLCMANKNLKKKSKMQWGMVTYAYNLST